MNVAAQSGGSLVDRAVRRVRQYIRERDLKVGDTLPGEGQFAADLGVSRAVMREAFGALAALRLIDVGNGRRARVGAIDGSVMAASIDHAVATEQVSTVEVWDVRRTLELRTASLAAEHRTDEEAALIVGHARAMALHAHDITSLIDHDIAFHQAIAQAGRNALFHQIVRSFEPLMRVAVPTAWDTRETDDQREAVLAVHRELGLAIADRDGAQAARLMDAHFDQSIANIIAR
ncbi:DNA-binding FadR family transcriptional regulator [Sphingomonas jinjuensis]|uniref:DNA-binding FadR family transcriptional regulator n=1 Tax=Sphingomonas jinjuensis TaxID=535907 RepID=A0A840FKW7_9SPHN|nr:FCD domain-containing protein [Sphingomonas jinjuensis]MBB4153965.1 DNA-binding FadR family transcriptional regulator [Sphingomonas jinjuensis]